MLELCLSHVNVIPGFALDHDVPTKRNLAHGIHFICYRLINMYIVFPTHQRTT